MLALLSFLALQVPIGANAEPSPPARYGGLYLSNVQPLQPAPFAKLPIGSIKPEGWLRKELELEAGGFTGHLEEISPWLQHKDNAWLSPTGEGKNGWEEVPYWLRGFGDLGYVLGDERIIKTAKVWIDGILGSQQPNGYFGPKSNLTANNGKPDVWPNMLALNALQTYYEYTGDKRIIPAMLRYCQWEASVPDKDMLLSYWEHVRTGDNIGSLLWLYNRTQDATVLELAKKFDRDGADWTKGVANWHGVNFAQGFREPAEISEITGNDGQRRASETDFETFHRLYGEVPGGGYAADENARPGYADPRQATETCTMVELMWSDEMLLTEQGDPTWADRCEEVAFNSLPASMTADEKSLHYLTAPNLVRIDANSHAPDYENGGPMLLFNPYDHRCCQHNSGMGWPYFAEHLWLATPDGGLTAALYAPNTVMAKVGKGTPVTITESTHYPFSEKIEFRLKLDAPTEFNLRLRVPGWETNPEIVVNHNPVFTVRDSQVISINGGPTQGYYAAIDRTWKSGDVVTLTLPMTAKVAAWPTQHNSVSVVRGPLAYSLKIGEDFKRGPGGTAEWPTWTVSPTTAWNFGLLQGSDLKVRETAWPKDDEPFKESNVPMQIQVKGRKVDSWQEDYLGTVGLLQDSPAATNEPVRDLTLIPMGAARLRISVFPTVTKNGDGTAWKPQPGHKPYPTKASFVGFFDVISAPSDGLEPKTSHDDSIPRFTWWDHKGTSEWIEYDLPAAKAVSAASVYWFDDATTGGGCRVPASWRLMAWTDGAWQEVKTSDNYGVAIDQFNKVTFPTLTASKWRLEAKLQPGFSSGILEWKLE